MENIDFLKKILTSGCEYWIAARRESVNMYGRLERSSDSIWFIAIPIEENIYLSKTEDEILVKDIERLRSLYVHNIAISKDYPPFQHGISLYNFYDGYPVKENHKEILKKALELGSNDIYDYRKLLEPQPETLNA